MFFACLLLMFYKCIGPISNVVAYPWVCLIISLPVLRKFGIRKRFMEHIYWVIRGVTVLFLEYNIYHNSYIIQI